MRVLPTTTPAGEAVDPTGLIVEALNEDANGGLIISPETGTVTRVSAGGAAPGQSIKTFTGKLALSTTAATPANVYVPTAGKTFYITDIYIGGDNAVAMDVQVQAAGVTVIRAAVKGDTAPLNMIGIESQPSVAGGQQLSILFPQLGVAANGFYLVCGFEQ